MMSYAKLNIKGTLEVKTGLHIGTSNAFAAIGATDSPVVKDTLTNLPLIPGSSLKGKLRSLLIKVYNEQIAESPDEDSMRIRRLFGDTVEFMSGRLIFKDMLLANAGVLKERGVRTLTEVKFENTIDRFTAVANPRQIERVIPGSTFGLDLIYEVDRDMSEAEVVEDIETLVSGLRLLKWDYLGGHGSRGYGQIECHDLVVELVFGQIPEGLLNDLEQALKTV